MHPLTLPSFVAKWVASTQTERSASQEHFLDLCALLDQPTPNSDPSGASYAFEKGVARTAGGDGFADVWLKDHFAWEYKGKKKNLKAAYDQLLQYREDLGNPPLLVVCDLNRFEVHTNFTGTTKRVYAFNLSDLARPEPTDTCPLPPLDVLRAAFTDPERLRPHDSTAHVTETAAREFATLATSLRARGTDPQEAAHFLMRLLFCLFAEDIGLLPPKLFTRLVEGTRTRPTAFSSGVSQLFTAMSKGGWFGADEIKRFNGALFANDHTLHLIVDDMAVLSRTAQLDWASIEPAIFGTLFERSLDPAKRAQLGAQYTSREYILLIVEPVLMAPLRRRWDEVRAQAGDLIARRDAATGAARTRHQQALQKLLTDFGAEIAAVKVLDPACGSGNFLYVALKRLLDLEKEVITFAATCGGGSFFPTVGPEQLYGIETNPYAHELASVVVWIGYIQWLHDNGFGHPSDPILKPLQNIERKDAILARDDAGALIEPPWPDAEVIIGNPPFLGDKRMRTELGDEYVVALRRLYEGRVPGGADLVTYWFERARTQIQAGKTKRAGLLATQGIRGGANRRVLERIKDTGNIFMAWSDRKWILDGAAVQVSMVGFDAGSEQTRILDGAATDTIHANLTGGTDVTRAQRLRENLGLSFIGASMHGPFELPPAEARRLLNAPGNVNGRPNADVVIPIKNAEQLAGRAPNRYVVFFPPDMSLEQAALYELPFEFVRINVAPVRQKNPRKMYRERWWIFGEPRPAMLSACRKLSRYLVTPRVAKHRLFVWAEPTELASDALTAIASGQDYFFGVLHSRAHELWARATGTQLREAESGFRYTPTTTFETFPFPWPPGQELQTNPRVTAIADAARDLVSLRDRWLNPAGATDSDLKQRTLTNLYNQRPTWLDQAHDRLDHAALDAYGWPHDLSDENLLERLLALNATREPV